MHSRLITLTLWLLWAWLVMTFTHEIGHVVTALAAGARPLQVELRPWHLPHSLFVGDPNPLVTLWAGPIIGCLVPLGIALLIRRPACWFVAWFCLLANGVYLLLGYFSGDKELDSMRLIQAGARPVDLLVAVVIMLPAGYWKFRSACIAVLTGKLPPMSRRASWMSAMAMLAAVAAQSILAAWLAA